MKWTMGQGSLFRTAVIVGVATATAVVMLSVGVKAAGQFVTLVDSDSRSQAQVDKGKLRVGDGGGPLTVDGTVVARPSLPARSSWRRYMGAEPNRHTLLRPTSTRVAITSITMTTFADTAAYVEIRQHNNRCTDFLAIPWTTVAEFTAPPSSGGSLHVDFPQPLVLSSAKREWCLSVVADRNVGLLAVGYYP